MDGAGGFDLLVSLLRFYINPKAHPERNAGIDIFYARQIFRQSEN